MPELKIVISAENQKALEELKQLQEKLFQLQETVKNYKGDWPLTHTIETAIPKLQQRITDLQGTLSQAGVAFDNFGSNSDKIVKGSNRAGLALNDLSRIAQDAPYGFIGISNNLNPMLESFQRLQKESGSAGAALKAMASSLMGPAGIGLAIGVASSLLVVFGDKLFKSSEASKAATEKAKEHADALKAQKQAIEQIYSSVAKEETQVLSLIAVLDNENETRNRKLKALEELKKINPEIFGGLNLEKNVVVGLNTAYEKYIGNLNSLILLKIKQKELEEVTEKILKAQGVALTQEDKDIQATGKSLKNSSDLKKTDNQLRKEGTDAQIKQNKEQVTLNGLLEQQRKITQQIKDVSEGIKLPEEKTKENTDKLNILGEAIKKLRTEYMPETALSKKMGGMDLSMIFGDTPEAVVAKEKKRIADINTLLKPVIQSMKSEGGLEDILSKKAKDMGNIFKVEDLALAENNRRIKEQQESYKSFARTISQDVTSALMGMYNAMQHGKSFGQAFLDMLGQMVEQLAALVIKTLVFDAIMAVLTGGTSAAATAASVAASNVAGSAGRMLMVPKYAEGGITTRPHIGMVGEAGPEAIMPLSKLGSMMNNTFNAGAMNNNNNTSNNGQFTLRGSDLVLALQRSNYSLNLRRGA